jgi:hypothetical protein
MKVVFHISSRVTLAILATLAEITVSSVTAVTLLLRCSGSEDIVWRSKNGASFNDAFHTLQRVQTSRIPAQEQVVVEPSMTILLPRTNGFIERFNGRIFSLLKTQRFNSC